jgi:hypothetical protein
VRDWKQRNRWERPYEITYEDGRHYIDASERKLAGAVKKTFFPKRPVTSRLAAYNPRLGVALVEVVQGGSGAECMWCWRVVLRQEGERWLIVSNRLAWEV